MYRSSGKTFEIAGVASGPYAGGPYEVAWDKLPAYTRERLLRALKGESAHGAALLRTRATPPSLTWNRLMTGDAPRAAMALSGAMLGCAVLGVLSTYGRTLLPWPTVLIGGALGAGIGTFGWAARPRGGRGTDLRELQGTHLLPLDVVQIHGQTVTVLPLGQVSSARIDVTQDKHTLRITFPHAEFMFDLRDAAHAESVEASLLRNHEQLLRFTHGGAFAESLERDPFFEVRSDDLWATLKPKAQIDSQRQAKKTMAVAALSFVAGTLALGYVNHLSREAIWRSYVLHEDYLGYLRRPDVHKADAARAEARLREDSCARKDVSPEADRQAQIAAMNRYDERASDDDAVRRVGHLVSTHNSLRIRFAPLRGPEGPPPSPAAAAAISPTTLGKLERRIAGALGIAISQTIPRDVMEVVLAPAGTEAHIEITPSASWDLHRSGKPGIGYVFEVRWRSHGAEDRQFVLKVPAAAEPPRNLRDRSLFSAPTLPGLDVSYEFENARAWDRLYDELFGMLFRGDPIVPLNLDDELKEFGTPLGR